MIAVSSSTAIQQQNQEQKTFYLNKNPTMHIAGMDASAIKGEIQPVKQSIGKSAYPVFPGFHNAVGSDSLGYVVMGFEDEAPNTWFTASGDNGANWIADAVGWMIDPEPELPDVDSCGDGRFIGGMVPHFQAGEGGDLYKVEIYDPMTMPDGYSCPYWGWYDVSDPDVHYYDFKAIAVAGYTATDPVENTWAYGGHSIVGTYRHDTEPVLMEDIPMFSYQFQEDGYAWIYRWDGAENCTSTAHDIDPGTLYSYAAWNLDNEGVMDIYVAVMDFGTWEPYSGYVIHPDVKDLGLETPGNDDYIDISALNDNVIIVSERDGDIYAYYSMDGMGSALDAFIDSGYNPRIVHIGEQIAMCSYIKNEQVYTSYTEDGGETWSIPELVDEPENDYVPEELKASDVCGSGVSWMNDDDGYAYFAQVSGGTGDPPATPTITGPTETKPNKDTEYTFTTIDPDGDPVHYYVEWGDGSTIDWEGPFTSGAPFTTSHSWSEKQLYIIRCKARDSNGLESGFATLEISTPRNYGLLFRLIEYIQHMFPNLLGKLGL
jgi:hypothetical protein